MMRWKMERAGIFNFWYYDDQEFHFSDGRLILRGANGSGKSVTMQSFIPLVLDGDKRPWRLDPFGSRDRRIEYYLLGDADSGIHDRTGYLYLEFRHEESDKTLTIGIGMRARKGISGIGFWGFLLQDQRRIGKNFFLYDRDHYRKYGEKLPLLRDALTEQIGAGGKVVREQSAYRKLVNQALFGFAEEEGYQELLDLLIQLRSPKLSKDFKPSTIYGILTDSLPPLKEEELRPLSEVLEDMDQISDTLDELAIHRKEVERLHNVYTKYNEFRLYHVSKQWLEQQNDYEKKQKALRSTQEEVEQLSQQWDEWERKREASEQKRKNLESEIEILEHHEAIEKQKELEQQKAYHKEILEQIDRIKRRLTEAEQRRNKHEKEYESVSEKMKQQQSLQREHLSDLEGTARDAEFTEHDVYHRQFEERLLEDLGVWKAWKRDASEHATRLQKALQLSREEEQAKERVKETEAEMSEAREKRDACEKRLRDAEVRMEAVIEDYENRFYEWYRSLRTLPLSEDAWRDMMHRLPDYPEMPYSEIKQPAVQAYEDTREKWQGDIVRLEHERNEWEREKAQLQQELDEWRTKKDPEPPRRESRMRYREKRKAQSGAHRAESLGAPLYACCDFQPGLSDEEKARLESVLEYTGLLDAWIGPEQIVTEGSVWHEEIEEFMLFSEPIDSGPTLADILQPEPSDEYSITEKEIWDALKTVRFEREYLNPETLKQNAVWINDQGQFRLGQLFGQVEVKPKAQYIGKHAREKMRAEMIAQLEAQIAEVEQRIADQQAEIREVHERLNELKAELMQMPSEEDLQKAERERQLAKRDLEHAQHVLEKADQMHRRAVQHWRELQQELKRYTDRWSGIKNRRQLQQASEDMQDYQLLLGELQSATRILLTMQQQLDRLSEEIEWCDEQLAGEAEQHQKWNRKRKETEHKIGTLTRLLEEMGILNIHEQLQSLKAEHVQALEELKECEKRIKALEIDQAVKSDRAEKLQEEFQLVQSRRDEAKQLWLGEWRRKLLPDWEKEYGQAAVDALQQTEATDQTEEEQSWKSLLQLAKKAEQTYRKKHRDQSHDKAMSELLDVFNEVKNVLLDYVLESHYEESSERFLIYSMRDRQRPISPRALLDELVQMEEEQRQLMDEKDKELYEQIILHSVGKAIRHKINRAEQWVKQMNRLMDERKTSSGLKLSLTWEPKPPRNETELDVEKLVGLLRKDPELLRDDEIAQMVDHFRSRIRLAKEEAAEKESLRKWISDFLDYRRWFDFHLYYKKGEQKRRLLTDSRFNVLSGGEKAMSMYIPLFAATYSRYSDSRPDSPKIISLDEAFAGVDDENIRDLFHLLTDMDFDYMMTSQVIWGCYDTVPNLSIYEIIRPKDVDYVTLLRYHWNGYRRQMVIEEPEDETEERAGAEEEEDQVRQEQISLDAFTMNEGE